MAIGTLNDMKVYEEQFFGGMYEVLDQNVDAFNASSNGCITFRNDRLKGKFLQESFFKVPSGLIADRDPTSTGDATATILDQGEYVSPKVSKRIGPVDNTYDSFRKIGVGPDTMAFVLGQQAAPAIQGAYLNSAISALVGAYKVAGVASNLSYDNTANSTKTMTPAALIGGLSKMGDAANSIALWVFNSKVWFDLMQQQVSDKLLEVTAGVLYAGVPATLGKPVLVTDSAALFDAGTSASTDDNYYSFGLTQGALEVIESEERSVIIQPVTGKNNLVLRLQGEFAYNVGVKGLAWNTATSHPTDAQLATSSNWTKAASSYKSLAGVRIVTK